MQYIQGTDRTQAVLFPRSLDEIIDEDNEVRIIDLFVNSIDLAQFNFRIKSSPEGRPPYNPRDLLKLYVYGYLNSIRSSRALEKECKRNVELMWLLHQLVPDHNTISNFRKDNEKAIRKVFRHTVSIAKSFDLIGGKLIAGDSTKLRAQNSKKNNFNESKITQHLQYIEKRLDEYNQALEEADEENRKTIQQQIEKQNQRKEKYNQLSEQLLNSGETQISTSDPDSRQMIIRNSITEVAYNVQTTVDARHNITLDYKVTNENDSKAMGAMLRRAKTILGHTDFTALYDKGYHTGSELKRGIEMGIELMVAIPGVASFAPDDNYNFDKFSYDAQNDNYTCPQGSILLTNGSWYVKSKERYLYHVKHYKTSACSTCPALSRCTKNKKGRLIERSEYQPYVDQNKQNIESDSDTYKKRQAIIEHTYGIVKRQWGFYFVSTKKGIKRASADVGFMFTAFNLRRLMNILDKNALKEYLRALAQTFFTKTTLLKAFSEPMFYSIFFSAFYLSQGKAAA
ncbi:IS1182 family transposase [Paraflavisolibacter sp. H34]|uniref:IS1182 family transposase n=1 Tax=Huijunlia imazamoxiresistens TaxID=3127457 RepID=UPI00301768EF